MYKNARHKEILEIVQKHGYCGVEWLSEEFKVSAQTIRRDIAEMVNQNLVTKYHGGVLALSSVKNVNFQTRYALQAMEKQWIAEAALNCIPEHSMIFVTIGTTVEAFASRVDKCYEVVTNSLNVASMLSMKENVGITVVPGRVNTSNSGITGYEAIRYVGSFVADYVVFSGGAIGEDGIILDYNRGEVDVAQKMMSMSRHKLLLLKSEMYNTKANVALANIEDMDTVITDKEPPKRLLDKMIGSGVKLIVATKNGSRQIR